MMLSPQTACIPESGEKLLQPASQPFTPGGSQSSPGFTMLSPQRIVELQTLGLAVHLLKGSTLHAAEQPSPLTRAPSSQASPATSKPSPQIAAHPALEQR